MIEVEIKLVSLLSRLDGKDTFIISKRVIKGTTIKHLLVTMTDYEQIRTILDNESKTDYETMILVSKYF